MKKNFWATFLIALIAFSALFAGVGHFVLNKDSAASTEEEDNSEAEEVLKDKDEMIFLLMGVDDEYNTGGVKRLKEKRKKSEDKYITTGYRSDTMILCKYNFKTGEISMLSIPRDTKTNIRGRKNQEKITHAHSYGGPYLAMDAVRDLLKIDLKYYATVDYLAVKEIVDAIGGVEIDVPRNMYYKDVVAKPPLIINIKKGQQTLDGDKSIEYLRFRSYPEGDLGRIEAQQLFMKEFIKQTFKLKNFTIPKLYKMTKAYYDYVDTNIPMSVALKGIDSVKDIDFDNIKMVRLPGEGINTKPSYFIYDEEETKVLVEEMFSGFLLTE